MHPFDPDRVLKDIQRPTARLTVPVSGKAQAMSCLLDEIPQTPVTTEYIIALQSLIEKDTGVFDDINKQRVRKLANAAKVSFAEGALLRDENQFLFKQNNEAKHRRSTKSTVVGKAKVMSYEDIKVAQAKRAARDANKGTMVIKGKRGRKRKEPSLSIIGRPKKARKNEMEMAQDEIAAAGMEDYCSVIQFTSD